MNVGSKRLGFAALTALVCVAAWVWYSDSDDDPRSAEIQSVAAAAASAPASAAVSLKLEVATVLPFATVGQPTESPSPTVNGRWAGQVELGAGRAAKFSFNLRATSGQLTGTATFPIGEGSIQDGSIDGKRLAFTTHHRVQSTGQALVSRFTGEWSDSAITLNMQSDGMDSKFVVVRVSR